MKLKYIVTENNLPDYIDMKVLDKPNISGILQLEDGSAPVWNTSTGVLGKFSEGDEIDVDMDAVPSLGTSIVYSLLDTNQQLPFGVLLDEDVGRLVGSIKPFISPFNRSNESPFFEDELPVWSTSSGFISLLDEGDTFQYQLESISNSNYTM